MRYPQIGNWLFMGYLWNPVLFSFLYGIAVIFLRNKGRANLHAHANRALLILFFCLSFVNWYLVVFLVYYAIQLDYSMYCEPSSKFHNVPEGDDSSDGIDFGSWLSLFSESNDDNDNATQIQELAVAELLWIFMISKLIEFSDQIILLYANHQVHIMDIIHHIVMACLAWVALRFAPGGSTVNWIIINTAFLSVAYSYQTIRRAFPNLMQDWGPIRDAVFNAKIAHLCLVAIHCCTVIDMIDCGYPKASAFVLLIFVLIILYKQYGGNPPGGGTLVGGNGVRQAGMQQGEEEEED